MTGTDSSSEDALKRARTAVDTLYADDVATRALGVELLDVAPGRVRVALTVRPDMVNGYGIVHGGLLFMLADSAFAFACNTYGVPMVAANASIEFLAPASLGERLIASAGETARTERHGIYDVVITNAHGKQFAHFRGRCARLREPSRSGSSLESQ